MKTTVMMGQTLWDIAIQHCGSADAAFAVARLNNISITDMPGPGTELTMPDVMNKQLVNYYMNNNISPATGITATASTPEGIGYWIIENDFIIK